MRVGDLDALPVEAQLHRTVQVEVHGARITTLGERAEDVFYLSAGDGKPLSDAMLQALKQAIIEALS